MTTHVSRQHHAISSVTAVDSQTTPRVTLPGGQVVARVFLAVAGLVLSLLAPLALSAPASAGPTAPAAAQSADPVVDVDAGGQVTCQVTASGTLSCAGQNEFGQLGVGDTKDRMRMTQVGEAGRWRQVSTSGGATCAVTRTHDLYCWGMNSSGQLGIGDAGQQWRPRRVGAAGIWRQVSIGWMSTCAVRVEGSLYCWGGNYSGQLGTGNRTSSRVPKRVGNSSSWGTVAVGGFHACGTGRDGVPYCWGKNDLGQLGTGDKSGRLVPVRVATTTRFRHLDAGWSTTCGLTNGGRAACWGLGDQGQLGRGDAAVSKSGSPTPRLVDLGTRTLTSVALGDSHACAGDSSGEMWCWGGNHYGQLGVGGGGASTAPVAVAGGTSYTRVETGWMHSCGVTPGGALQCWGNNEEGQLFSGNRAERAAPPGVSARRMLPRRRGPDGRLVVTSFNVLGSQHTRPGGGTPHFGPGRIRTEWAADALRGMGSDLVSFQELQHDQYNQLRAALGDTYTFYPENTTRDPKLVWQSVMWRTSEWQLVEAKDISVPVNGKLRPNPFVKLRNRATGRSIWMMNVHNSSKRTPERQRDRNAAVRIELDHVKQQRRTGTPVLLMGDFNEREVAFCKVTGQTDLQAVNGGSRTATRCTPPRGMHIDWIFGAPAFKRREYAYLRSPLTNRITDHTVLTGVYGYLGA